MSYLDGFRALALLLVVAAPFIWIMKKPQFKKPGGASDANIRKGDKVFIQGKKRRTSQKTNELSSASKLPHT